MPLFASSTISEPLLFTSVTLDSRLHMLFQDMRWWKPPNGAWASSLSKARHPLLRNQLQKIGRIIDTGTGQGRRARPAIVLLDPTIGKACNFGTEDTVCLLYDLANTVGEIKMSLHSPLLQKPPNAVRKRGPTADDKGSLAWKAWARAG
jgi:hypothetical protein